jgi:hypothetical protein
MKKILLLLLITIGCAREDYAGFQTLYPNLVGEMSIAEITGLKFEGSNITNGSKFNLKVLEAGKYTIEIRDPFKNLTSKSIIDAKSGDNVMKFYTKALQGGDYNIIIIKDKTELHNTKLVIK